MNRKKNNLKRAIDIQKIKKLQKILQFYRNMSPNLDEIFIILCENMSDILNIQYLQNNTTRKTTDLNFLFYFHFNYR